ncbi:hypothetical protein KI387_025347, partial [Taxus chinensis]
MKQDKARRFLAVDVKFELQFIDRVAYAIRSMGQEINPYVFGFDNSSHPLLNKSDSEDESGHFKYNSGHRPYHDICFLIFFVTFVSTTYAIGVFSVIKHNKNYKHVGSFVYDHNSSSCIKPVDEIMASRNSHWALINSSRNELGMWVLLTSVSEQLQFEFDNRHLAKELAWTLAVTLILSIPFLFIFLWLLNTFTKHIVYAFLPFFILIPIFMDVLWFVACEVNEHCKESFSPLLRISVFLFTFALCGIIVWIIYANRGLIELTIRVLHTASEALRRNMALLLVLPGLNLLLFLYLVPIIVFLLFARSNGKIIPNPNIEVDGYSCRVTGGVDCCVWRVEQWVPAYYGLAIFTLIWSVTTMLEAQVYIVSGTVAQWYFEIPGSSSTASISSSIRMWTPVGVWSARTRNKDHHINHPLQVALNPILNEEHMNVSKEQINNLEPISPSNQLENSHTEVINGEIQIQKEFSSSMNNKEDEVLLELEDFDDEEDPIEIEPNMRLFAKDEVEKVSDQSTSIQYNQGRAATCDELRHEQEGEEKGRFGNHFPNRYDDNKLARLIIKAVKKEHNDEELGFGKSYKGIPSTSDQGMEIVQKWEAPLIEQTRTKKREHLDDRPRGSRDSTLDGTDANIFNENHLEKNLLRHGGRVKRGSFDDMFISVSKFSMGMELILLLDVVRLLIFFWLIKEGDHLRNSRY